MAETFRRTKLERFVKRLEAKLPVLSKHKSEAIKEVVADLKHEFNLKEEQK
jgi:hydrogenase maturation factor HypF (carbamoyltransferase family)